MNLKRQFLIFLLPLPMMICAGCATATPEMGAPRREDSVERPIADPGDINIGMQMKDVMDSWGEPREIQVAGEPTSGNQKWIYFEGLSSPWGMGNSREVYFEGGRVAGWRSIASH